MSDEMRFDGKVAVITGAGGGVGRAYALDLARRGARVPPAWDGELGGGSSQVELAVSMSTVDRVEELSAKELGQDSDGQEEALATGDPALAVG